MAVGKNFERGKISFPSQHEVEDDPRCYLAEEVQQIIRAAEERYKVLFKLVAETGARAGELYALTVGDLLFGQNVIRIHKSMFQQKVSSPKTKKATGHGDPDTTSKRGERKALSSRQNGEPAREWRRFE